MRICIYGYIRISICTYAYNYISNNRKTVSQLINTNEHTRICIYGCIRMFICTYAYNYTRIRIYLYVHVHILIRIYAYTYTHIRIYLYAYYAHVLVKIYLSGTVELWYQGGLVEPHTVGKKRKPVN